jgi:D-alanyl-lipoteichoic acid acyltransferase DltB (MBOAT superfamily)
VDVYKGRVRAERNLLDYALYVSFFPQLVAGPIERAGHMLPQYHRERRFDPASWRAGIILLLWGFLKKVVIADNAAVVANKVFALSSPSFPVLWAGVFAFAIQIYADFSGYTELLRGCARLLGFELMENFRHPYIATSPADFWRRWHISFSSCLRDFVYIPLGGNRAGVIRASFKPHGHICSQWPLARSIVEFRALGSVLGIINLAATISACGGCHTTDPMVW